MEACERDQIRAVSIVAGFVRCRFLTAMPGVNPSYREEAFYKATIDTDSARVQALFDAAPARDIRIERRSLSPQQASPLWRMVL